MRSDPYFPRRPTILAIGGALGSLGLGTECLFAQENAIEKSLKAAQAQFDAGQWPLAEEALSKIVAQPTADQVQVLRAADLLAECYLLTERFQRAEVANDDLKRRLAVAKSLGASNRVMFEQLYNGRVAAIKLRGRGQTRVAGRDDRPPTNDEIKVLRAAREQLNAALALPQAIQRQNPLWEPTTRLWVAGLNDSLKLRDAEPARLAASELEVLLARGLQPDFSEQQLVLAIQLYVEAQRRNERSASAIDVLRVLPQKNKLNDETRARLLQSQSECQRAIGLPAESRKLLLQAIDIAERLSNPAPELTLDLYASLGDKSHFSTQSDRVTHWSAKLQTELTRLKEGAVALPASCLAPLQRLEQLALADGDDVLAVAVDQLALTTRERLQLTNDANLARLRLTLGTCFGRALRLEAAREELEAARRQFARWPNEFALEMAVVDNNLAGIALAEGKVAAAEAALSTALPVLRKMLATDDARLAEALNNQGYADCVSGRYLPAKKSYEEALAICRAISGKTAPKDQLLQATVLLNLSHLYQAQGQLDEAERQCRAAFNLIRDGRFAAEQQVPFDTALASLNIALAKTGTAAERRKRLHEADRQLQAVVDALSAARKEKTLALATALHLQGVARYQLYLSVEPSDAKLLASAEATSREALALAEAARQPALKLRILIQLTRAALDDWQRNATKPQTAQELATDERFQRARRYSNEAYPLLMDRALPNYPGLRYVGLENHAQLLRRAGERSAAREVLSEALTGIEEQRSRVLGGDQERAEYYVRFSSGFDRLVEWSLADGSPENPATWAAALAVTEAKRSRSFRDQLQARGMHLEEMIQRDNPVAAKKRRELSDRLRQATLLLRAATDPAMEAQCIQQLDEAMREFAENDRRIQADCRGYQRLLAGSVPANAWSEKAGLELARSAVEKGGGALVFHVGATGSSLFSISSRGEIHATRLAVTAENARQLGIAAGPLREVDACALVNRLLRSWCDDPKQPGAAENALSSAQELAIAETLLPTSVRDQIHASGCSWLTVIPDGPLHRLPLEALRIAGKERYLIDDERFPALAYAPSLTILNSLRERRGEKFPWQVLSVADPDYQALRKGLSGTARIDSPAALTNFFRANLEDLPGSADESKRLAAALGKRAPEIAAVKRFTRDGATEAHVLKELPRHQILHLAAHGLANEQYENLFGGVALLPTEATADSPAQDGVLALHEIAALDLDRCELAILSACQTNVGPQRPLEAGSTLARAFLAAGARRVVCSQWNLHDAATTEVVGAFCDQLAADLRHPETVNYAVELAIAKRKARARFARPGQWAPLILIGPARVARFPIE